MIFFCINVDATIGTREVLQIRDRYRLFAFDEGARSSPSAYAPQFVICVGACRSAMTCGNVG